MNLLLNVGPCLASFRLPSYKSITVAMPTVEFHCFGLTHRKTASTDLINTQISAIEVKNPTFIHILQIHPKGRSKFLLSW